MVIIIILVRGRRAKDGAVLAHVICPSVYLSVYLSVCLSIYLSPYLSTYLLEVHARDVHPARPQDPPDELEARAGLAVAPLNNNNNDDNQ